MTQPALSMVGLGVFGRDRLDQVHAYGPSFDGSRHAGRHEVDGGGASVMSLGHWQVHQSPPPRWLLLELHRGKREAHRWRCCSVLTC